MAKEITQFQGEWRWLSNFWMCPVPVGGIVYPSSEHAYQASKVLDMAARAKIADMATPGEAKRAGQVLTLRPGWERAKKRVMLLVVLAKFSNNHDLARQLAATGDAYLEEGNTWHDFYWGVCRSYQDDPHPKNCPGYGHGTNYLGRILTMVRDIVRED
jgi:N-glycosidase YbiA